MLGGRQVTRYKDEGEQYDVIVQVTPRDRANPTDISGIYVRARDGSMVQLDNLLGVHEGVSPQSLNHFNRLRAVKIDGAVAPGYALGEVLTHMHQVAREVLPTTVVTDLDGQSREFRDSSGSIYLVFAMALAFIYLVLAAQFESWRNPFIIMLSVPLSMTGALLALWLSGGTLSIYSQIGLITLVGLITKHGILIVEFTNQLRDEGRELFEAVTEASVLRLRPILMTTGAMVLGTVPLALSHGAGAESRQQIGWVLVGGLMLGTLLTLFVVPVAYTLIATARRKPGHAGGTQPQAPAQPAAPRRGVGPSVGIALHMRQIIFDSETTGLDPAQGHRIVEIGCVELVNRMSTGNNLHIYLNPDRESDPEALAVHGLTTEFLSDKPRFADVADEFVKFIAGAELIAQCRVRREVLQRRTGQDRPQADHRLLRDRHRFAAARALAVPRQAQLAGRVVRPLWHLQRARTLHGALLDAQLLAEVWLAMTRGQDALLIDVEEDASAGGAGVVLTKFDASGLPVLRADAAGCPSTKGIWPRWTSPWAASACGARWNRRRAESAPQTN